MRHLKKISQTLALIFMLQPAWAAPTVNASTSSHTAILQHITKAGHVKDIKVSAAKDTSAPMITIKMDNGQNYSVIVANVTDAGQFLALTQDEGVMGSANAQASMGAINAQGSISALVAALAASIAPLPASALSNAASAAATTSTTSNATASPPSPSHG